MINNNIQKEESDKQKRVTFQATIKSLESKLLFTWYQLRTMKSNYHQLKNQQHFNNNNSITNESSKFSFITFTVSV